MPIRYLARRSLHAVLVIWGTFTITFLMLYVLPSDPVELMMGSRSGNGAESRVDPTVLASLRQEYGLDRPLIAQYVDLLTRTLRGDFGSSIRTGRPVLDTVLDAAPYTLALDAAALVVSLVLGVGTALAAVRARQGWLRQLLLSLPPLGVAMPSFLIGLVLIQVFAFRLRIFPPLGNEGFAALVLPAITLGVPTAAVIAQVLTEKMLQTLDNPFVDTARAKGASRNRVLFRHVFRSGLVPLVTMLGMVVGNLFAGAVVIETVFSRKGLGSLTQSSIDSQDVPVIQAIVLLSAAAFVFVNLAVDLAYPWLDPRIRSLSLRKEEP